MIKHYSPRFKMENCQNKSINNSNSINLICQWPNIPGSVGSSQTRFNLKLFSIACNYLKKRKEN